MPTYDAALRWNRDHPIGTPVIVTLANALSVEDQTASGAVQWGSIALVTLRNRPGMWMTSMLTSAPAQTPSSTVESAKRLATFTKEPAPSIQPE
jgi:hypothetical protein